MSFNIFTHLSRLGAVGIGILLTWQLSQTLPESMKILTKIEARQEILFGEHKALQDELQQQSRLQNYLLRGICIGMHKTPQAQQQFCNPLQQ